MRYYLSVLLIVCFGISCFGQFPGKDLLNGRKKLELPFEYVHGFIVLEVQFNGFLPLKFIFDTGAENTLVLKKEITDLLNINYSKKISLIGSDLNSTIFAYIARNVGLKFESSGHFTQDILVLEEDLNNLDEITGMHIDGIIGANVFKNLVVEINYRNTKLVFYDPDYFDRPLKRFTKLPLIIKKNKPYINCMTGIGNNNEIPVVLLIDSGASLNYLLHENTHPDIDLPESIIPGNIGTGIGGNLKGYMGKTNHLTVGEFVFEGVTTSFQNLDESILENFQYVRNGILGNKILERFTLIIHYPKQEIYLRPRKQLFKKTFEYDKSGLVIFAIGRNFDKYYIKEVIPGTPAHEAGVKSGDYIVKFNGFGTRFLSLESITNSLSKKPGKRIRLSVIRNGKKLKKEFYLEDILEKKV